MKFIDVLKKIWKFIVGLAAGIVATLLLGRLFRGKKNNVSVDIGADVPDSLLSELYYNGGRAATIRADHSDATDAIDRAGDRVDRLEAGNRDLQTELDKSAELIRGIRARRVRDTKPTP